MLILLAVTAVPALSACEDDDSGGAADDPRRAEIEGVAALAVGAYASSGPIVFSDYLSEDALERCPADQLEAALGDQTVPTGFKELGDVEFDDDTAVATLVVSTDDGDQEIVWTYVDQDGHWRIEEMPGLENCNS